MCHVDRTRWFIAVYCQFFFVVLAMLMPSWLLTMELYPKLRIRHALLFTRSTYHISPDH
jgi:hypothetical protein